MADQPSAWTSARSVSVYWSDSLGGYLLDAECADGSRVEELILLQSSCRQQCLLCRVRETLAMVRVSVPATVHLVLGDGL